MNKNKILKGKLVVSIEQAVAAPYCSVKLADAGARVIKVERKEGDFARYYDKFVNGDSAYFVWLNRGKQSMIANIKNKTDVAFLRKIISKADIFIQNLVPNSLKKYNLDSQSLRKINKNLITCDISGYGDRGSYSKMKAYDLLIQAETGLCSLTGTENSASRVGISVCDVACGLNAYTLILEALLKREKSGEGSSIKISLFESLSEWMNVPYLQFLYTNNFPKRSGLSHPSIVPYGCFKTKDNKSILFSIQNEREWLLFSNLILKISNSKKYQFENPSLRLKHKVELNKIIEDIFKKLNSDILVKKLKKISIAFGFLNSVKELAKHPQLNTAVSKSNNKQFIFIPPVSLDKRKKYDYVPKLGQHTKKIKEDFS